MKKLILLVLCFAMCFGLFACKQKEIEEQVDMITDSNDFMAQGEIRSQKLEPFLSEVADAYGLKENDFVKQEIKGGEYYYEAHTADKKILRLVSEDGYDANGRRAVYAVLYQIENDETKPDFQETGELKRYEMSIK